MHATLRRAAQPESNLPEDLIAADTDSEISQDGCRLAKGALASWYRLRESRKHSWRNDFTEHAPGVEQLNAVRGIISKQYSMCDDYKEMVGI